ncbi:hypothetical protein DL763_002782 [Monosporascus cannonballus]|nr:hypothetical protein DL763_002782 [Monosporascus cannonballus]
MVASDFVTPNLLLAHAPRRSSPPPSHFRLLCPAHAALRFGCSTLSIQRLDPLIEPGNIPSQHLHHIAGGSVCNASMKGGIGEQASCMTCIFSEEFSQLQDRAPVLQGTERHLQAGWDGENVDSPDHQSHMYSIGRAGFRPAGPWPASRSVRMPQLAYDTMWDTVQFDGLWPADGLPQPFAPSYNDDKGCGTHAKHVFGWKGDSLQGAMDSECMFQGCGHSVLERRAWPT